MHLKGNYYWLLAAAGGAVAGGIGLAKIAPRIKERSLRATTILKKDHRVVSGLFWTLQQTTIPSLRKSIFNQIKQQLEMHAQVEEEFFYPAVRNLYTTIAENQVDEANREHQKIKNLLREIAAADPVSYVFMSKVNELKKWSKVMCKRKRTRCSRLRRTICRITNSTTSAGVFTSARHS